MTNEEILNLFNACDNLGDKRILMTIYDTGLRLNEVAYLKISDVVDYLQ